MILRSKYATSWLQYKILSCAFLLMLQLQLLPYAGCMQTIQHTTFGKADCRDMQLEYPQCICLENYNEFEIECESTKFKMDIQPTVGTQLECGMKNGSVYKQLPKLNIGNSPHVHIRQCPLPGNVPIAGILDELGIRGVSIFRFENNNLNINLDHKHFDRLKHLEKLRISVNGLTHLPANLLSDMRNLTWLDFRTNIPELPVDIFADLENLNFLELAYNNLTELPPGIFRNLRKLKHLNMWSNQLRNLSKHTFEGISIEDLDLSANGIEYLPSDIFEPLTELKDINLNGNKFHELPAGLFRQNKQLTLVRLVNNRVPMETLPASLFANLPKLDTVRITCGLTSLPGDLFQNSSNIRIITLASNELTRLPDTLFLDQMEVINIDLQRNRLTSLPDSLFRNTPKLTILNLSFNEITEISGDVFSVLRDLTQLHLNNNRLKTIDPSAFQFALNLTHVYMQNNQIDLRESIYKMEDGSLAEEAYSPFRFCENLHVLNLRNNSIIRFFTDWHSLKTLDVLDLSYNKLSMVETRHLQFTQNNMLLNLTHNQITKVLLQNLSSLNNNKLIIDLNDNPLYCDCTQLHLVQFLRGEYAIDKAKFFKLVTDRLECLKPEKMKRRLVQHIKPRDLICALDSDNDSNMRLCPRGCECWVRTLDRMILVNCSNANLVEFPALPSPRDHQLNSTELYFENNRLKKLPTADTAGYADITHLHLAGNNITTIDVEQLPIHLRYLDVRHNQINRLNVTVLNFFNQTNMPSSSLRLAHNPWECSCDTKDLLIFTQTNYKMIDDRNEMYCMGGEKPTKMEDLSVSDVCISDRVLLVALALVISLFACLICVTAALYYKYQQETKIWLYAHKICLWFVTEEELDKDKKYDAFISYSSKDEKFIVDHIIPQLEHGPIRFKLCLHDRDWKVGGYIPEQIVTSVEESRRTIIILSKNFINSTWARMEFRTAHTAALNEGRARVIPIIYGDIGNIDDLDKELQAYLKMNTYVKWGDPWFWDKLRFAMPHPSKHLNGFIKTPLKGSMDDKLELIKPSPVTPPLTTPPAEATKNPLVAQLNGDTAQTAVMIANGKNMLPTYCVPNANGKSHNGHINGAFIINTNAKQSDV